MLPCFAAQFTAKDLLCPLGRRVRCFRQLACNETGDEPMSPAIWCVVVHKKVVGVPSGVRQIISTEDPNLNVGRILVAFPIVVPPIRHQRDAMLRDQR